MDPEERRARLDQIMKLLKSSKPGSGLGGTVADTVTGAARDVVLGWDEEKYLREKPRYPVGFGDRGKIELEHWNRKQVLDRLLSPDPGDVVIDEGDLDFTHRMPWVRDPTTPDEFDLAEGAHGLSYGTDLERLHGAFLDKYGNRKWDELKPRRQTKPKPSPRSQDDAPGSRRNR